jgi:flagellar motor switch protein FliN/FliY
MASAASTRLTARLADGVARALLPFRVNVRAVAIEEVSREGGFVDWTQPLNVAPLAPLWIGAPAETWTALQQAAGVRDTFAAFAGRAISEFAQTVGARLAVPCFPAPGSESAPSAAADFFRLEIETGAATLAIFAGISAGLVHALRKEKAENTVAASVDLLLDVELPVAVSFGRAFLPVREVLRMTTGSMIELNRHVNDYVDVIVNN